MVFIEHNIFSKTSIMYDSLDLDLSVIKSRSKLWLDLDLNLSHYS